MDNEGDKGLSKDEVLKRPELKYAEKPQDIRIQGQWGDNFFEDDDGVEWYPIIYHGQPRKRKLGKRSRVEGDEQ